jgi:hypothetical protein
VPSIDRVWNCQKPEVWEQGLKDYWRYVKPSLRALEHELADLDADTVRAMDARQWYTFLLEKYFRWKFTAPNRYASTTKSLKEFATPAFLPHLLDIKDRLFATDKNEIKQCLATASLIGGLGTAGASGLLSILFPEHFGTADQFAVKALRQVPDLPEAAQLAAMKPESLWTVDGVILVQIMRRKAAELNKIFGVNNWTPRKIDMVLWAYGHTC